jgi:hypothetical protein
MCELFEVVFFTASTSNYAEKVLDALDPERRALHRLFRQHCTLINCEFVKDLSQLGRDLKDVIIVDNLPSCYSLQPCNGIPILTWIENKSDRELDRLSSVLEPLSKVDDVRDYLREVVRDNELDYPQAIRLLSGEITLEEIQRNPSAYWTSPRKKAPPKERTQSQKKLMPYLGNLKENLDNTKNIVSNNTDIKNENISAVRKMSVDVPILSRETVTEIKEQLTIEVSPSTIKINSAVEHSKTPKNIKGHKSLVNRTNSSNAVSNTPTYYSSKPAPLPGKQKKSIFAKPPSNSVRNTEKPSNIKLPPRPNYKQNTNSFTPRPITNLSSEANKYVGGNNMGQKKPPAYTYRRPSTDDSETTIQVNSYKPPAMPPYARYVNTKPTLHRYPVRNEHGSSTLIAQSSHRNSDILGGSYTPSRNYGSFNSSVSGRVWAPKLY